jgi:hypothetical protein
LYVWQVDNEGNVAYPLLGCFSPNQATVSGFALVHTPDDCIGEDVGPRQVIVVYRCTG